MKEIRVYGCYECPFLVTKLPSSGSGTIIFSCGLIKYLKLKTKNNNIKDLYKTPKWCPMRREEEIIFQFREMSELVFLQSIVEKIKETYQTDEAYLDEIYNQIYFKYKDERVDIQCGDKRTFWVSSKNMSMQCKKNELLFCIDHIIKSVEKQNKEKET